MEGRILIVDDNPINLKLACNVLADSGFTVEQAVNAEDALVLIKQAEFDLILMDIGLPGMDGLTLTSLLKADEETRDIPVIALTAFAMKGDEQKVYQAGCDAYITKPIDTRKFAGQVEEVLHRRNHER